MCKTCIINLKALVPCWKCETVSVWIYTALPDNVRPASQSDLFDSLNNPRYNTRFLAMSSDESHYQAYTFNTLLNKREVQQLIKEERIFVHVDHS